MEGNGLKAYEKIESLYKTSRNVLTHIAFNFVRNESLAKDIVGEAFLTLIEHREEIDTANYYSYLYTTVKNKSINCRKADLLHSEIARKIKEKESRMMEHYTRAIESTDNAEISLNEILNICSKTLDGLSPTSKAVFLKSRKYGKTRTEIAAEMGLSENVVKYELKKVLTSLRYALEDYLPVYILIIISLHIR